MKCTDSGHPVHQQSHRDYYPIYVNSVVSKEAHSSRKDAFFVKDIFLFLHENIYCGYPLEAAHQGASYEYPQCMFFMEK